MTEDQNPLNVKEIVEDMEQAVQRALSDLLTAVREMMSQTMPHTNPPEDIETFCIYQNVLIWPHDYAGSSIEFRLCHVSMRESASHRGLDDRGLPTRILELGGYDPRKILGAVQVLESAQQWCQQKALVRQNEAKKILRLGSEALKTLTGKETPKTRRILEV